MCKLLSTPVKWINLYIWIRICTYIYTHIYKVKQKGFVFIFGFETSKYHGKLWFFTTSKWMQTRFPLGFHTFSGNLVQLHPPVKNFFLLCNVNLPYFSLDPFPLVLSPHALANSPSPAFLDTPFRYWKVAVGSLHSLLFSRLSYATPLSLSAQNSVDSFVLYASQYPVLLNF